MPKISPKKKRRTYRKKGMKLKLRDKTIYSIFSFGVIIFGLLLYLSYTRSGEVLVLLNDKLTQYFGSASFILPLAIILLGFMFLGLKSFISRPNVALGYLLAALSVMGITKTGEVGQGFFGTLASLISPIGTGMVFSAGIVVGIIVLFDTSIDEIGSFIAMIFSNLWRFFPKSLLGVFKSKPKMAGVGNLKDKPMMIKGGQKVDAYPAVQNAAPPQTQHMQQTKKDGEQLSDKLVANTLMHGIWEYPPLSLLSDASSQKADRGDVKRIASIIEKTLQSFGVEARVVEVNLGPAVTQYALELSLGTKVAKITGLANDLALATEAPTGQIRIEAPIPGRNLVGIEIPNRSLEMVALKTMLGSQAMQKSKSKLSVSMGLDVSGNPLVADIAKMPHVLIAGTTGSGKSVMMNSIITSLLFRASPNEVKFILVDPKRVEFTAYNGIPHLMTPVIVEPEKILSALKWAMGEMDRRYKTFAERAVRNIEGYNELSGFQALPYIVIVIDELADLMMFAPVEVEDAIARIAQMARATGIHLVIATQRPSVNVITGLIKANIPTRIAFSVSSMIDSRVIIDGPGAEKLLGRGDMLYIPPDQAKPTRIQGAFVSEKEVKRLVDFLKEKSPAVEYTDEILTQSVHVGKKNGAGASGGGDNDALFEEAVRVVCQFDKASASLLQRRLKVGYARAARIIDELEGAGFIGVGEGAKPRDVLIRNPDEALANLQAQQ